MQIQTYEFHSVNQRSFIDCTKRNNKNQITLHCRNCDPDFSLQDEYIETLMMVIGYIKQKKSEGKVRSTEVSLESPQRKTLFGRITVSHPECRDMSLFSLLLFLCHR